MFPFNLTVCLLTVQVALPALAALAGSQLRTSNQSRNQPATNQQSHEMTVPNELIGCIIGKVCILLIMYYHFRRKCKEWDETLSYAILPFSLAWYFRFFKLEHKLSPELRTWLFSKLITHLTVGRHQDRRNPPDLWRYDPDIELRGAWRRQHRPNHHHIRQPGLCRARAVPHQHEVSPYIFKDLIPLPESFHPKSIWHILPLHDLAQSV